MQQTQVRSLGQEDPLEKEMAVFLPGESYGQRNLAGYSPWSYKQLDADAMILVFFNVLYNSK